MSLDKLEKTKKVYKQYPKLFSDKRKYCWPELVFLFQDFIKPGDKILDLGCGNGRFFPLVKAKKAMYLGIDSSPGLIAIAQQQYPQAFFHIGDALNLSLPDKQYDKVYLIALLHHFLTPGQRNQCLGEARRVLKDNGLLLLTVWHPPLARQWQLKNKKLFFRNLFLKLTGRLGWRDFIKPLDQQQTAPAYYHFFSQKELIRLVSKQGFKVIETGIAANKTHHRSNIYLVARK